MINTVLKGYRRHLVLCYISNIATRINAGTIESREFVKSLKGILDEIDIDARKISTASLDLSSQDTSERDRRPSTNEWEAIRNAIENERVATDRFEPDQLYRRIREFSELMNLNETDVALLEFFLYYEIDPSVEHCIDEILDYQPNARSRYGSFSVLNPNVARMVGMSRGRIRERFVADAPLVQSGIVSVDQVGEITLLNRLRRLAYEPTSSTRQLHQILFEKASSSELEWQDFEHVEAGRDHIERLIVGALANAERGVNVLIHGPPGTGKTEFCKTLAERIGVTLFSVGESDAHGHEPSRAERLQELRLAERVLAATRNSVLLFDEMEDLLSDSSISRSWYSRNNQRHSRDSEGSKVFLHRLLERNVVPVMWTSNAAYRTHPALLRRMMYALELSQPSSPIRARIWQRQLKRHGIQSTHQDAESLARSFDVTPGVVDRAVVAARLIDGGGMSTVYRGVESLERLIHGPKPPQTSMSDFDLSLICANTNLSELSNRLVALGGSRFSLCLQGPPGTGKSAFVRYLCKRLGLEILQKRASDLLSMWVGETEIRIAKAFAEAREKEQFLVFDEAESLLADRRFAERNWEVSQVNEMLTWMESHPMPFACTTNYDERLDPATLRRFDFKLRLDYLTPEQVRTAFRVFFDMAPPDEVGSLTNLTPGDFAVVKRRVEVLGKKNETDAITAMLKEESNAKPDRMHPIGFQNGDV